MSLATGSSQAFRVPASQRLCAKAVGAGKASRQEQESREEEEEEEEPRESAEQAYATLTALLAANHTAAHIEYSRYLSNHLPHALISLWHLGATSRRLLAYAALYSQRLEPPRQPETDSLPVDQPTAEETQKGEEGASSRNSMQRRGERDRRRRQLVSIDSDNWRHFLGRRRHFLAYRLHFAQQLHTVQRQHAEQQPQPPLQQHELSSATPQAADCDVRAATASEQFAVRALLARYFPSLLPGASHSALHPLIHTGWALSCGSAGLSTLSEGLAYLCYSHFHTLDPPDADYSAAGLAEVDGANSHSLLATLQSTVSACAAYRVLPAMEAAVLCVPYCEMDIGAFQRKLAWLSLVHPQLLRRLSCLLRLDSTTPELALPSLFLHVLFLFAVSGDDFFVSTRSTQPLRHPSVKLRCLLIHSLFVQSLGVSAVSGTSLRHCAVFAVAAAASPAG